MVPSDRTLKQLEKRLFVTNRNKRVFVSTSREKAGGMFPYRIPHKSYEVIVLLAWEGNDEAKLKAFVVPQKVYRSQWSQIPKDEKELDLVLTREGGNYFLNIAGSHIDVSPFEGDYQPVA